MKKYFEKLATEKSWFKLFLPIFVGMTILVEFGTPLIMYIVQVLIKKNEYDYPGFGYGVCVSLIYCAILAGVISSNHQKSGDKDDDER